MLELKHVCHGKKKSYFDKVCQRRSLRDSEDDKMKTPSDLEDDNGTKETATLKETDAMLARVVCSPNQPEGACTK